MTWDQINKFLILLSDNYRKIVTEIEQNVSNPQEREFVRQKLIELSTMFLEVIDNLAEKTDAKITRIEEKQKEIEVKISQVEGAVDEIESDIYEADDGSFDFEIVCPYCNNEFITEIDGKTEIECPECNNIIELDWNDEEDSGCAGSCSSCPGCSPEYDDEDDEEDM